MQMRKARGAGLHTIDRGSPTVIAYDLMLGKCFSCVSNRRRRGFKDLSRRGPGHECELRTILSRIACYDLAHCSRNKQLIGWRNMTEHILSVNGSACQSEPRKFRAALRPLIATLLISATAAAESPCPPQISAGDGVTVIGGAQSCPVDATHLSSTPDYQDPLSSCSGLAARRVVSVATATALQQAMNSASCGDTIQLAAGTYDAALSINKSCPATNPIIVQGAANFASTISNTFTIDGTRNIVTRLQFSGPNSNARLGGNNNKLLANRFTDWRPIAVIPVTGDKGEIAYNEFYVPHPWLASETGTYPLRMGIRTAEKDQSNFHFDAWIHHNYFHDFPKKPNSSDYSSGQSDAIEVCQTNRSWTYSTPSGWYIEQNLIERHMQGHGIVDLKCSGVVVRHNTVLDSPDGRIDIRFGVGSTIESNWQENSGGTVVNGGNHRVIGNYMRGGGGITLLSGNQEYDSGAAGAGHNRAYNVLVAGNDTNALIIGKAYNSEMRAFQALNNTIEAHSNSTPVLDVQQNTTIKPTTNVSFAPAFKLNTGIVGPSAMSQASASYLECRAP